MIKNGKSELEEVFGTKDPKEQAERAKSLLQIAQSPVIDVIVRYDMRTDTIGLQVIGADPPGEIVQKILHRAVELIHERQLKNAQAGVASHLPAPESPVLEAAPRPEAITGDPNA
jgi:hypothetical protein